MQETMKNMQDGVDALKKWCKKWFVALNPLKLQLVGNCQKHRREIDKLKPTLRLFAENI